MTKLRKLTAVLSLLIIDVCVKLVPSIPANSIGSERSKSLLECLRDPKTAELCAALLPFAKSADILAFMQPQLDPCDDFYEFACGNWPRVNKAVTKPSTGFFERLSDGLSLKIGEILNESDSIDAENDKKVKRFYKSCMKLLDVPFEQHNQSFKKIIAEFGSMPAIVGASWNASGFNWLETLARIQYKYGIQSIIGAVIMADFKDNSQNRIYFGQAEIPLQKKSMYLDESTEKYRILYKRKIAFQLEKYLQIEKEKANEVAKSIVEFEQFLAEGMLDDIVSQSLDEIAKLVTPAELSSKYAPTLNVTRYLEIAFGEPITNSIYDCSEEFQIHLKNELDKVPQETLANYIFYQLVSEFFPKVAADQKSQHEICCEVVKSHFAKLLDNMIYRRYKEKNTENDIDAVWLKIKTAFDKKLNSTSVSWISPSIREQARKKLNAMKLEVNSYVDTNFSVEMKDLHISNDEFIKNVQHINENSARRLIKKLHEPPSPFEADEELSYTPVNIILENTIKIPVSLLQPYYLWNQAYPDAIMYGTLGFLIGHELIHGFDDNGREYDETGNQRDWWDVKSTDVFISRTECFMDQYHQYVFGGRQLPRSESQAENIADNGGVRIAYDAYLNWLEHNEDRQLPYLEKYSSKQLFFISYAQVWCSDIEENTKDLQAVTDEHTPAKFRVIGVLSNSEEFAKEFECAPGSRMNPAKKCVIY